MEQDFRRVETEASTPFSVGARARLARVATRYLPSALLWVVMLALIGLPIFVLVITALNVGNPLDSFPTAFGLGNFANVLEHLDWITNTLVMAFGAMLIATAIGIALAWAIYRTNLPLGRILTILIILPYPMGPLVAALAWSVLGAPHTGLINVMLHALLGAHLTLNIYGMVGVIVVQALFEVPIPFLIVGAAIRNMDASLEEASAVSGGGRLRTALSVTMPLMVPAIAGSALFLFVSNLGAFAIPAILGAESRLYVATTAIYILFQGFPPNYPLAAAVGVVLMALTALTVVGFNRLIKSRSFAVIGSKTYRSAPRDAGAWRWPLFAFVWGYIVLGLILPLGALVLASVQRTDYVDLRSLTFLLDNYRYVLVTFPGTREAIVNSLILGVGTATFGTLLALLVATSVYRSKDPGGQGLEQLVMSVQAAPRLVFAIALLWLIILLPIHLYGTLWSILIAYVVVFLPLGYRSVGGVVTQASTDLEEVARVIGAHRGRVLRTVTWPLMRSGLVATWMLIFMISLAEVGASVMLSGPRSLVLGPTIYNFWNSGGLGEISALSIVETIIVFAALGIMQLAGRLELRM